MTGLDNVNLPRFTKKDAVDAARLGLSRDEYVDRIQRQVALREQAASDQRDRKIEAARARRDEDIRSGAAIPRGTRVAVDDREYLALSSIAVLARAFMPLLEEAGAPTKMPREWNLLRECLSSVSASGWGELYGRDNAVSDLLDILRQTDG